MQGVPAIAEFLHGSGPIVLQHHVGAVQQLLENRTVLIGLEIKRDVLLAMVEGGELGAFTILEGREGTGVIARAGAFHLDDMRAQIGHGHRGKGTGQHMGQVQNRDTCQWLRHMRSLLWGRTMHSVGLQWHPDKDQTPFRLTSQADWRHIRHHDHPECSHRPVTRHAMIWTALLLVAGLIGIWWWTASRRMLRQSHGPKVAPRPGRALLLVDLQEGIWRTPRYDEATRTRVEAAVSREVAVARDRDIPVIALKQDVAAPVARLIAPRAASGLLAVPFQGMADHVITRWAEDGFETGELDNLLDVLCVGRLRIMGQDGAHSVVRTAQAALDRGIEVELVRDGIATSDDERYDGAVEALLGQGARRV